MTGRHGGAGGVKRGDDIVMGAQNESQGKGRDHDQRGRDQHRREQPALAPVLGEGTAAVSPLPLAVEPSEGVTAPSGPSGLSPSERRTRRGSLLARPLFGTCSGGVGVGPPWARRAASAMAASARAPGISAAGTPVSEREPRRRSRPVGC